MIQLDELWGYVYSRFDHSDSLVEHFLRFVEFLSDPSSGLRFAAACHTRAYFLLIFSFHFGIRWHCPSSFQRSEPSHHSFWHSELWIIFPFGVQSHHAFSFATLRVIFCSLTLIVISFVWRSEPLSSILAFRVSSSVWRLEPFFSCGIQSCYSFPVRRSEPLFSFSFGA